MNGFQRRRLSSREAWSTRIGPSAAHLRSRAGRALLVVAVLAAWVAAVVGPGLAMGWVDAPVIAGVVAASGVCAVVQLVYFQRYLLACRIAAKHHVRYRGESRDIPLGRARAFDVWLGAHETKVRGDESQG